MTNINKLSMQFLNEHGSLDMVQEWKKEEYQEKLMKLLGFRTKGTPGLSGEWDGEDPGSEEWCPGEEWAAGEDRAPAEEEKTPFRCGQMMCVSEVSATA